MRATTLSTQQREALTLLSKVDYALDGDITTLEGNTPFVNGRVVRNLKLKGLAENVNPAFNWRFRITPAGRIALGIPSGLVLDDCFATNEHTPIGRDTTTHEAVKAGPRHETCDRCRGAGYMLCGQCEYGYRTNSWGDQVMCDCDSDFHRDCWQCRGTGKVELPPLILDGLHVTDSTVTPSAKVGPHEMVDVIPPLVCTVPALLLPALTPSTRNARYNAQLAARCGAYPTPPCDPERVIYLPAPADVERPLRHEAQRNAWLERSANAADPTPRRTPCNGTFRLYSEPLTLTATDDSFGGFYPLSDKLPDVRVLTSGKSGPAFESGKDAKNTGSWPYWGNTPMEPLPGYREAVAAARAGR